MKQFVMEGMLVIAAGRAYVASRPPVLARPRRGSADLPDRDAPDYTHYTREDVPVLPEEPASGDRWIVPASLGIAAVAGTIVARAIVLI